MYAHIACTSCDHLYRASPKARVGSKPPKTLPRMMTVFASSAGCSDCILRSFISGCNSRAVQRGPTSSIRWDSFPSDPQSGHRHASYPSHLRLLPRLLLQLGCHQCTLRTSCGERYQIAPSKHSFLFPRTSAQMLREIYDHSHLTLLATWKQLP